MTPAAERDGAEEAFDPPRPFMEHLLALRSCLIGAALWWLACCITAGIFSPTIIGWMQSPVQEYESSRRNDVLSADEIWRDAIIEAASAKAALDAVSALPPAAPGHALSRDRLREKFDSAIARVKDAEKKRREADSKVVSIQGFKVTSGFALILESALWGGTVLAFPFFIYYALKFIFPALRKREKRVIICCLAGGSLFFAGGIWMAYSKTLPLAVDVLMRFSEWIGLSVKIVEVGDLFSLVLKTLVAFGLVFQIPLILFALGWLGVISSATLARFRRFAIVIAFFFGMVLTPPDPMSQLVMAIPLCVCYELCIWLVRLHEVLSMRKEREQAA